MIPWHDEQTWPWHRELIFRQFNGLGREIALRPILRIIGIAESKRFGVDEWLPVARKRQIVREPSSRDFFGPSRSPAFDRSFCVLDRHLRRQFRSVNRFRH